MAGGPGVAGGSVAAGGADAGRRSLRLGVVGVGARAVLARHAGAPGLDAAVVAVADPRPGAAARARELFGPVEVVADHRGLLEAGLDGVFVTSPDDTHESVAVDLLEAGIAVFVEKPLAITTEGADRVLATAVATGSIVFVGHNMRHLPVIRAMRDLVTGGAVGEVQAVWCRHFVGNGGDYYFRDWHAERRHTTGLLLQKGAHDLDVIHWLAGGVSRTVTAMGTLAVYGRVADRRPPGTPPAGLLDSWFDEAHWPPLAVTGLNPVIDVEDLSMMLMRLDTGVLASYQQCHFTPDYWRNYTVIGTEGRLENFGDTAGAQIRLWNRRSGYRAEADRTVEISDAPAGARTHGGADPALVAEFLGLLRGGDRTVSSPVAAREAVAAGTAATVSLREGSRPVDVPPPAPEVLAALGP